MHQMLSCYGSHQTHLGCAKFSSRDRGNYTGIRHGNPIAWLLMFYRSNSIVNTADHCYSNSGMSNKTNKDKKPSATEKVSAEDAALFRDMVGDVKPLPDANKRDPIERRPKPNPRRPSNKASAVLDAQSGLVQSEYVTTVAPEESLYFAHPGLQHKLSQRLRRGQIAVEAALDLHGNTIESAAQELQRFLADAREAGFRCVIIVHGKGHRSLENKPVLKSQVNHWLRQHPGVLAFSSALPKDGGVGAVYVLLRKINK